MAEKNGQVWFITGANKGLGAAIAKEALDRGYRVVATSRNPQKVVEILGSSPNLVTLQLDITDDGQVESAVKAALERFGRIDVLVNNAGYALLGFFEEMSEKLIRQQMETNVFGTMKVTRAVLPLMRRQGSGLVVVISSASGVRSVGGASIYSASKFALEGWTEGMSIDLKPFGIRCMLIEPGPFRTDFANLETSLAFSDLEIYDYRQQRETLRNAFASLHQTQPGDPARLAGALMTAVNASDPPLRLLVGKAAVAAVDQYLNGRLAEYEAWRVISASADFDENQGK
ncbi:MAG TPA: SDR family oxidoreductase [Syntrophorhabdales bacterium]|nr:SDR family oxidoreductase [Syntrophorhabdales bacterium]